VHEGRALLERSVSLAPAHAGLRHNFGLMLAEAGDLAAAEAQFYELTRLHPRDAAAHSHLGMMRQRLGRFGEALAAYHEALRLAPRDPGAANNLCYCLLERGDVDGALRWLRRALAAAPDNAIVHNNLGNALRTRGEAAAAAQSYRRAIALAPSFADAHHNLALALRDLGNPAAALGAARAAVRSAPDHAPAWQLFADLLAGRRFATWDADLAADCEHLLGETQVDVQDCAEALLSLVRAGPPGALFLLLLEHALVAEEAFEREMTELRRAQLFAPESIELACALASQCFLNEYVWAAQEDELAALERLEGATALEVALAAMYRRPTAPEAAHPLPRRKPAGGGPAFERMWRRLVEEPAIEARIEVPALSSVEDAVSREVQAQYEANPYPRWHRAPAAGAFPLARMLRALFPHIAPARLEAPDAPAILIAGCGTGRHAAITAQLQPLGRVLALDLSGPSLAYAMRRAGELGLANLRFAQADILRLGALEERFDLIECSGVLHHMADPLTGWRVLLGLLKPGGFMKLGLYSQVGRRHVIAAREAAAGLEVRAARRRILELPAEHPARAVATLRDFYSASGARDLILHVQEHRFTLPQLARAMDTLGVEFLGFELEAEALKAYRARFPADPAGASLENWDAFEQAHPDTFASMYQFWIRR
jgi:Flp pilus assembly protein TadD/SAM-dependent methyltransferase